MSDQFIPQVHQFENHKIHFFMHKGRPAFLAREVGELLGIKYVKDGIRESKALIEGEDYGVLTRKDIEQSELNSLSSEIFSKSSSRVIILYESGLNLFVIRSNKPEAAPFIRWVIREVIPKAVRELVSSPQQDIAVPMLNDPKILITPAILKLMELENKGSKFAAQALTDLGFAPEPKEVTHG